MFIYELLIEESKSLERVKEIINEKINKLIFKFLININN